MINVLLDPLPEDFEGKRINYDFRIGVQLMILVNDETLTTEEKAETSLSLLFLDLPDSPEQYARGLEFFLTGWMHDNPQNKKHDRVMDFDQDQWRIYAAFLSQYRIDLSLVKMHFWTFMGLLTNLGECAYTQVIDTRMKKFTPKMSVQEKTALSAAKKMYAIGPVEEEDEEDQEALEEFLKYVRRNK